MDGNQHTKATGIAELRRGSDAHTYLVSAGLSYKLDADWSLLARTIVTDSQGQGGSAGNDRRLMRNQIGVALRPAGQDVWNALARYERKYEHVGIASSAAANSATNSASAANTSTTLGGVGTPGTYSTDIVSAHLNFNPARGNYLTGRYAGKVSRADDGLLASRYWAHLVQGRYTRDIAPDWDVGVQAGLLLGQGGAVQKTFGLEGGYQVTRNTWVSVGYNIIGLTDRDLAGADYTSKGVYIRLRFKFDENTLGLGTPARSDEGKTVTLSAPETMRLQAAPAWKPGSALPPRVVFTESQLFVPAQTTLSPAGVALLGQLGAQLAAQGIGEIEVIARDPAPTAAASNVLWFGRAAAVRSALRAHGPRAVTISTDSQALSALPPAAQAVSGGATDAAPAARPSLQIALVAN